MAKTNDECATLRKGSLPKASAVVDAKCDEGAHKKCVIKQTGNDTGVIMTGKDANAENKGL